MVTRSDSAIATDTTAVTTDTTAVVSVAMAESERRGLYMTRFMFCFISGAYMCLY